MSKQTPSFVTSGDQVKIVRLRDKELDRFLPPADTKRWVTRRKAQVVSAVRDGVISFEDACNRYSLSQEEFQSWMTLLDRHGMRGLRATRMQEYRPADERHPVDAVAE